MDFTRLVGPNSFTQPSESEQMPQVDAFNIAAIRGIRFDPRHVVSIGQVVCPQREDIAPELQETLYKRHPANMVRVIANRSELGDEPGDAERRAGRFFKQWISEGVMIRDPSPSFYILRDNDSRVGVIGSVALSQLPDPPETDSDRVASELNQLQTIRHHTRSLLVSCEMDVERIVQVASRNSAVATADAFDASVSMWVIDHADDQAEVRQAIKSVGASFDSDQLAAAKTYCAGQVEKSDGDSGVNSHASIMIMLVDSAANAPPNWAGLVSHSLDS